MDKTLDYLVVILYFAAMIGAGYWGLKRARSAVVLGGASTTIGGVGLGYQYGVSGMWLVFMLGLGDYTVSKMLGIR